MEAPRRRRQIVRRARRNRSELAEPHRTIGRLHAQFGRNEKVVPGPDVVVGLVQAETPGTVERTRAVAAEAVRQGAQVVVFPESWIPGYPAWLDCCRDVALWDHAPVKKVFARLAEASVVVAGESGRALRAIAQELGVTLVVGVTERVERGPGRGTLYNALLTIGPDGALLNHHRKLVPTYTERMVWGVGDADGLRAVDTPCCRVGGLICWEHWMPLARQALHESGEDVHVAVWPMVHERHQLASRHYAFEGRCYVLAVGAVMRAAALPAELEPHPDIVPSADAWVLRGGSAVIAPDGSYVVEPIYDREAVIVAQLDLARSREESMTLDVAGHYHRPELLALQVRRGTRAADV
jgi:nitrilase